MNIPTEPQIPPLPRQPEPQPAPETEKDDDELRTWTAEAFEPQRPPQGRRPLFGH